jgi:hypothetical protein
MHLATVLTAQQQFRDQAVSTIHCGPDGIYGSALGSANGDGPGGIFLMDANTTMTVK